MSDKFSMISELIASRRAIFPKFYIDREIPDHLIKQILDNGNWAPNHRKTEPWRFKIFKGKSLKSLSNYQVDYLQKNDPEISESKLERVRIKVLQSECIIAIVLHHDPGERVPEWEELAATACAVQNIWLSCTALGIGSYWSSPSFILHARKFLGLKENEKCLGLFYMGYCDANHVFQGERGPIEEKIEWM